MTAPKGQKGRKIMGEHSAIIKPHLDPNDDPFEPQGYYCHKCGEWYPENEMHRLDRAKDSVYYCHECWKDVEVECEICSLLHHPDETCDHDGQYPYGG
jgi:hypothetical protein